MQYTTGRLDSMAASTEFLKTLTSQKLLLPNCLYILLCLSTYHTQTFFRNADSKGFAPL